MTRLLTLVLVLLAIAGCRLREAVAGVSEPIVTGTASSSFDPHVVHRLALLIPPVRDRDSTRNPAVESAVRDAFTTRLLASGYEVVAESTLTSAMGRGWVSASDIDVAQAARALGVAAVLVAEVTDNMVSDHGGGVLDYRFGISARLVAAYGAIWWSARHAGTHALDQRGDESAVAAPIARGVAKAFPGR